MHTEIASSRQAALRRAFENADYHVVDADRMWLVRAGQRHPELDRALGLTRWAIVTAHNPGGRRCDGRFNRLRDRAFRAEVARHRWLTFKTIGRDPAGDWPDEPGLLIDGAPAAAIATLARRFEQAAVLTARAGEIARVEFMKPDDRASGSRD